MRLCYAIVIFLLVVKGIGNTFRHRQQMKEVYQSFNSLRETCRMMETNVIEAYRQIKVTQDIARTSQELADEAVRQRDECLRARKPL